MNAIEIAEARECQRSLFTASEYDGDALRGWASIHLKRALDEVERLQAPKLRVFCLRDNHDGRTWVIAENEHEALGLFAVCDDFGNDDWNFARFAVTLVDAGKVITITAEECDGGDKAFTAERWCAERGKCVLCSTWWEA